MIHVTDWLPTLQHVASLEGALQPNMEIVTKPLDGNFTIISFVNTINNIYKACVFAIRCVLYIFENLKITLINMTVIFARLLISVTSKRL